VPRTQKCRQRMEGRKIFHPYGGGASALVIQAAKPGHVFFRDAATVPAMVGGWQGVFALTICIATRYNTGMIISFRHKGLELFYQTGSTKGIQAAHATKLRLILAVLDVATSPQAITLQAFKSHQLKGKMSGFWSIWVNGNWRVVFRFATGDVELVDYLDYH